MNKVVYKDDSKNIPGFSEALTDEPNNFMWDILNLMDDLYKVSFEYAYLTFKNLIVVCLCLLYTSPSPRDVEESRMPSSA